MSMFGPQILQMPSSRPSSTTPESPGTQPHGSLRIDGKIEHMLGVKNPVRPDCNILLQITRVPKPGGDNPSGIVTNVSGFVMTMFGSPQILHGSLSSLTAKRLV